MHCTTIINVYGSENRRHVMLI